MQNKWETLSQAHSSRFIIQRDPYLMEDEQAVVHAAKLKRLVALAGVRHIKYQNSRSGDNGLNNLFSVELVPDRSIDDVFRAAWPRAIVTIDSQTVRNETVIAPNRVKKYSEMMNKVLTGSLLEISKNRNLATRLSRDSISDIVILSGAATLATNFFSENREPIATDFAEGFLALLALSAIYHGFKMVAATEEQDGKGMPTSILSSVHPDRHLLLAALLTTPLVKPKAN